MRRLGAVVGVLLPAVLAGGAQAAAAPRAPSTYGESGPTGRLVVTLRDDHATATAGDARRLVAPDGVLGAAGLGAPTSAPAPGTVVVPGGDAAVRSALTRRLKADPRVASVVPERRAALRSLPDDPVLREQDPLAPPETPYAWWVQAMGLPQAWDAVNGRGVTIAVIDSGVDASHPQLAPVVADAERTGSTTGTARTDEIGHGTHVASLACSAFNDGQGTIGAGGRCRLLTIKSDLTDSSVTSAIRLATARGVDAIVMSFGTDQGTRAPASMAAALRRAADKGIVAVAAAADQPVEDQGYPSNVLQPTGTGPKIDEGIGLDVAAAQHGGTRASFSGRGSQISLAAYGTYGAGGPPGLLGAFPAGQVVYDQGTPRGDGTTSPPIAQRTTLDGSDDYAYEQGTSMAAPIVAGVAGLVHGANPDLDAREITTVMKRTATRSGGWTPDLGWGIVDADRAVQAARRIDLHPPRATFRSRSRRVSGSRATLAFTATDRGPKPTIASGLRRVEVWRSTGSSRFRRVATTTRRSVAVSVPVGRSRFALVAVDRDGNRQTLTSRGDVVLRRG